MLVLLENVESLNLMQTYLNIIRTKMNNFSFFFSALYLYFNIYFARIFSTSGGWLWMMKNMKNKKVCDENDDDEQNVGRMIIMGNVF